MNNVNLPDVDEILQAIRDGVEAAFWRALTNATDMPCADLYDTIQKGVKEAFAERDVSEES